MLSELRHLFQRLALKSSSQSMHKRCVAVPCSTASHGAVPWVNVRCHSAKQRIRQTFGSGVKALTRGAATYSRASGGNVHQLRTWIIVMFHSQLRVHKPTPVSSACRIDIFLSCLSPARHVCRKGWLLFHVEFVMSLSISLSL